MRFAAGLLLAAGALTLLTGCTYLDQATGQTNNKVLPGQREDAIPGRPTFPDKPDPTVAQAPGAPAASPATASGCTANDPACKPPANTSDTFKDPQ